MVWKGDMYDLRIEPGTIRVDVVTEILQDLLDPTYVVLLSCTDCRQDLES